MQLRPASFPVVASNRLSTCAPLPRIALVLGLAGALPGCSSPPSVSDSPGGAGGGSGAAGQAGSTAMGGAAGTAAGSGGSMTAQGGSAGSEGGAAGTGGTAMAQAGSAGAAGTGGSDAVVSDLCPATALFCDDFEDDTAGQFPGAPWTDSTGSGATVTVDAVRAFSGSNAVHVNAPPSQNDQDTYRRGYFSLQGNSPIFPAAALEMYGRAMMWLDATPDGTVHWTIVQGEGRDGDNTHNRLYRYGGQQQGGAGLMANYETTDISTDCWQHSATTMPTGQWACVEWRFAVASNEMQMWLDGTELADIHTTGSGEGCIGDALDGQWLAPPAFQSLYLGWERYQRANNDRNLWVDDVVVSTERVGCPE